MFSRFPMSFRKQSMLFYFFLLFLVLYAFFLVSNVHLAPTDDFIFLRTLQSDALLLYYHDNFPYYDAAQAGRFTPLAAMEYNIYHLFSSSPSPFWYYFSHAAQLLILAFVGFTILARVLPSFFARYSFLITLTLLPGFTFTWFRLQLNERDMLFFLALFLWSYFSYHAREKWLTLVFGIIAVNCVIYYKEIGFVLVGAFALLHLIFSFKTASRGVRIFDGLLLVSSALYALFYFFYILPQGGTFAHGATSFSYIASLKNLLNYAFVSDPFIIWIVLPLAVSRAFRIGLRKDVPHPLFDSMLFAAVAYVAAIFFFHLYGVYYFLPLYLFAAFPVFYFLPFLFRSWVWKVLTYLSIFLILFNTLPLGIHYLTYYKYLPIHFNSTLDFVVHDIPFRHPEGRAVIFLDGLDRCGGKWMYFIYSEFLLSKGLDSSRFDLRADRESQLRCPFPLPIPIPMPYTIFETGALPSISSGDYLILSPESIDPVRTPGNRDYLASLQKDYVLLWHTESPLVFPLFTIKEAGRYLLSRGATPDQTFFGISRKAPNLELPNYYVFVRK